MVQAHKGYFKENGQFVPENLITKIPANRQIIILWDDEASENKKLTIEQQETAKNFLTAIQKIRKELTSEDKSALDELESGQYKPLFEDRSTIL